MGYLYSILLCVAPCLLWLWFFRSKDDRDSEPLHLLLFVFVLGGLGAVGLFFLRPHLELLLDGVSRTWELTVDSFLITALAEESLKCLAFLAVVWRRKAFDEPLGGVIYGITVGLGFAAAENLFFIMATDDGSLILQNSLTSTLGHVGFSGLFGLSAGLSRFSPPSLGIPFLFMGFTMAVFFHGVYAYFLILGRTGPALLMVLPLLLWVIRETILWMKERSLQYDPDRT